MKFLLIRAGEWEKQSERTIFSPMIHPPLGLLYVGAALENSGHVVKILDYCAENVSQERLRKIVLSSDVVGIEIYTKNCRNAVALSKMIKEIDASIPIVIGGPHCTFLKGRALTDVPLADISVMGEGEHTVIDIVQFLQGKKKLSNIPGIYYQENGRIKIGKPIEVISDLNKIPIPARHLVDKYDYGDFPWGYKLRKKVTAMITSRGCPFRCRFCTRYGNVIKNWGYRRRSVENVVTEIEEIDKNYGSLFIVDDNFLADVKRAHKIFDQILNNGINLELFIEGVRVDSANRALYKKMKKAGVKLLGFGIESGNQDVLDFYNKKVTLRQIREAVELSSEMGFLTFGSFIIGASIETKEHIEKTIKFACSLPLDVAYFQLLAYIRGSSLWAEAVQNNNISKEEHRVLADSNRGLGNFTLLELSEYVNQAFRRFYLRPTYVLNQFHGAILRKDPGLIYSGMRFITGL